MGDMENVIIGTKNIQIQLYTVCSVTIKEIATYIQVFIESLYKVKFLCSISVNGLVDLFS